MGDLSKHFSRSEFACGCGCGFDTVDAEVLQYLEKIREHFGVPVTINSGCRCNPHNTNVGGGANSLHLYGRAADIVVEGVDSGTVQSFAHSLNVPGLGRYNAFTHIDTRSTAYSRWSG